jgi:cobyrinic acid a,c-diamide synthase
MSGILIAAPSSGSGKTTFTLGLLRALRNAGVSIAPGKAGPDYIDPAFHAAASGETCLNFDPWAMRPEFLLSQAQSHGAGRHLVVEAMMGLYDGAADGSGSPADLAALLGLSVVLVVDCARMSQSVAALVSGYRDFRSDVHVAGVILNRVGSARHELMLKAALSKAGIPVFGSLPNDSTLGLPERHLGLVQAGEHQGLDAFAERAALMVETHCDLAALIALCKPDGLATAQNSPKLIPPLGQHIAVARDEAFAFSYPHLMSGWRGQGAEISFFSPLANEAPDIGADAIFLPGGYPELHAGRIASNGAFGGGMQQAARRGAKIYGECGGYMVLGEGLIDADGNPHAMLGLLPLETSFATRKRHLGYRKVWPLDGSFFSAPMTAHEFHYSTAVREGEADRLFSATDALGEDLGHFGLRRGNVAGSYLHLIDLSGEAS